MGTHGGGGLSDRSLKGGKGFADGLLGGLLLEGDLDPNLRARPHLCETSLGPLLTRGLVGRREAKALALHPHMLGFLPRGTGTFGALLWREDREGLGRLYREGF